MPATAASAHAPAAPSASFLARRPVWQVSYLAGLAASVLVETWGLAARAAGVPMRAAGLGSHHATAVTVGMFAMGTMVVPPSAQALDLLGTRQGPDRLAHGRQGQEPRDVDVRVDFAGCGGDERVAVEARVGRANGPCEPVVGSLRDDLAGRLVESPVGAHDPDRGVHPAAREVERRGEPLDGIK